MRPQQQSHSSIWPNSREEGDGWFRSLPWIVRGTAQEANCPADAHPDVIAWRSLSISSNSPSKASVLAVQHAGRNATLRRCELLLGVPPSSRPEWRITSRKFAFCAVPRTISTGDCENHPSPSSLELGQIELCFAVRPHGVISFDQQGMVFAH